MCSSDLSKVEIGDSILPSTYSFEWSLDNPSYFTNNTAEIQRVGFGTIDSNLDITTNYDWYLSSTISYNTPTTEYFDLYIKKNDNSVLGKQHKVDWTWGLFYGSTSSTTVSTSSVTSYFDKILSTSSNIILDINGNGYKYIYIQEDLD